MTAALYHPHGVVAATGARMELEQTIDAYLKEWLKTYPPAAVEPTWYVELIKHTVTLNSFVGPSNWINHEGNGHLWKASRLLLARTKEQRRLSVATARRCLEQAHSAHLIKARKTGILSEHAIVAKAIESIKNLPRSDGSYVVPISFAPSAKSTRFRVGPALILSRSAFDEDYLSAVNAQALVDDGFDRRAAGEWHSYSERYDHFIVIEINRHELEMAWKAAREIAEYVLNLIRIKFGFNHMDDVRIGNGFVWETSQVKLMFEKDGTANLALSWGPWASSLDDKWSDFFDDDVGSHALLLASLAHWIASGNDPESPVLERLRYANSLIAEAYSEPHDRIRLVRLVASLEALAALPSENKSEVLAWRCAFAGGWTDCGEAIKIVDDVRRAYKVRNAVVHGDPIIDDDVTTAFYLLERHMPGIYLGYHHLHAKVQRRYRPTHKRHIRQAFEQHIESFFWMPDEVW